MNTQEAIKELQGVVKDTTERINNPHIGSSSWNYENYKEAHELAKHRIRVLRGDCEISKGLVWMR